MDDSKIQLGVHHYFRIAAHQPEQHDAYEKVPSFHGLGAGHSGLCCAVVRRDDGWAPGFILSQHHDEQCTFHGGRRGRLDRTNLHYGECLIVGLSKMYLIMRKLLMASQCSHYFSPLSSPLPSCPIDQTRWSSTWIDWKHRFSIRTKGIQVGRHEDKTSVERTS
jgi:hypothetical protein